MVTDTQEGSRAHRPGLFKLPNKKHKTGQHRSKSEVARDNKGKLGVRNQTIKKNKTMTKSQRKNQVRQLWARKREQLLEKMQIQGSADSRAPFIATILSFDENTDSNTIIQRLESADSNCTTSKSGWGCAFSMTVPRFKMRYSFICPNQNDLSELLDCVRVSEVLLIVWPTSEVISEKQAHLLTTLMAQGLPVILHLVGGLPPNGKHRDQMRKVLEKSMSYWPSLREDKVHNFDTAGDAQKILRGISTIQKKPTILQQRHPHLLVERLEIEDENVEANTCLLKVSGFLRGAPLNVNKLVHIQGFGDFQLSKIEYEKVGNNHQTSIVTLIPTNPTPLPSNHPAVVEDQEMEEISEQNVEDDADEFNSDEDSEEDENEMDEETDEEENDDVGNDDDEAMSFAENSSMAAIANTKMDSDEAEKYRQERQDAQWPDETDTPRDVPARERFIKYRGLKSFRTSPWDAKENLPNDYSRIYKFSDFKQTKKNVLADLRKTFLSFKDEVNAKRKDSNHNATESTDVINDEIIFPGRFVTLYIANVPISIKEELLADKALVIFGLLTHEEKMSVMNMVLEKHPSCRLPVKNREKLIFQVGYRRFEADPLFSQHNNGNKFKMERFAPAEGTFCASVFAPIIIPPSTVLVFRRDARGQLRIVASGNVLDLNPDRIVLKRIVLSGHPFKVNKRLAVVRYMFFSKEDVEWFKPVEVYTAKGRRGHIKESLGTHGLMKCLFDQPLSTQDAVLMNLYKRTFPKFSYNVRVSLNGAPCAEGRSVSAIESMEE